MRSAQHQLLLEPTPQILWEATIVCKAIARHRREAISQGRTEEVREMEALGSGVYSMVLKLTLPPQQSNAA
jgi:hypothetical protein